MQDEAEKYKSTKPHRKGNQVEEVFISPDQALRQAEKGSRSMYIIKLSREGETITVITMFQSLDAYQKPLGFRW